MLSIGIRAKNDNDKQYLFFDKGGENEYFFTLVGQYKGEPIQIDFDELSGQDVEDFVALIRSRKSSE